MYLFLIFYVFLFLVCPQIEASDGPSVSSRYISYAIQGDLRPALDLFAQPNFQNDDASALELASQFQSRFIEQSEPKPISSGNRIIDSIAAVYREYWRRALMGELSRVESLVWLEASLEKAMQNEETTNVANSDEPGTGKRDSLGVFERLGDEIRKQGFHHLESPASPLRDLYIWKTQETASYTVKLTDQTRKVDVVFMSGIYSTGWKHYATLGLAATSGWIEDSKLYCVGWVYDLLSENFEISYLKHESRHLADLERFPTLSSEELEYRAKLTELAFAERSMSRLLDDFTSKSALNPSSPHAHANYRVTRNIYEQVYGKTFPGEAEPWLLVDAGRVNEAARELLVRNTMKLGELQQN